MIVSKAALNAIRQIVEKRYSSLIVSVLGRDVFSGPELEKLREAGVDTSNTASLLSLVYNAHLQNPPDSPIKPRDLRELHDQDTSEQTPSQMYSQENLNDKTRQFIEKLRQEVSTRIEGIIRENNDDYKRTVSNSPNTPGLLDELMQESSLGAVRQKLKDTAKEGNRDWELIAITEISNAVGLGSADRIVSENPNSNLSEVYVYRITTKDAKTCKYCRQFYQDSDGAPKLYRMATLLNNGSNYGKKTADWKPVTVATHPRERCSALIELKPGWSLTSSGSQTYIGLEAWSKYLDKKVES